MPEAESQNRQEQPRDNGSSAAAERFRELLTAVSKVSNTLSQAASLKEMCHEAITLGRQRLGFDRLGIWLVENDDPSRILGTFGVDENGELRDEWREEVSVSPDSVMGQLLRGRMISHYAPDTPLWNDRAEVVARGEQAVAALWDGERIIGVMSTDNLFKGEVIDEPQREVLGLFALSLGHLVSLKRTEQQRRDLLQKVQQTQKLESLGVMAGGIAHEFNNLLVGVLGNADLALADTPEDSPMWECLQDIRDSALRAADLTAQMLAYSGHGRFVIEPVDLNGMVRSLDSLIEATSRGRAVAKYDLEPSLPTVMADEAQVRQLVVNLVTNACESFVNWSGHVRIRTRCVSMASAQLLQCVHHAEAKDGRYVRLEIEDSGCGIPESVLGKVFDPFYTTKFAGRGLGLAAVLGIVMSHGGSLDVRSKEGEGSSFIVFLPVTERDAVQRDAPGDEDQEETVCRRAILIVDDEDNVRHVLKRLLVRHGYVVYEAADGREAVDVFADHSDEIALVVLDLTMPRLNGEEAFRSMRETRPDLPVLLISGYAEEDALEKFGESELAGFVHKPFLLEDILKRIQKIVGVF